VILQTERLNIRKFQPTDLESLIDLFTDQEVMRYLSSQANDGD
jgi:RimJ/RimL family protein N-acetyltransferase